MRIDEIAVDGFGLLRDRRLEPAPGLTLIRGENEAGKSTLLAFIRAILFGFETRAHPALAGGRRGGWLTVTAGDGRHLRVERYGQTGGNGQLRILDPDGDDLGAEMLARVMLGVERPVYNNVFAFGLAELAQFANLTGAEIAARIYGAGMGTGATSVVDIENRLEKRRSELFVKQGRNPRINLLLAEIDVLDSRIEALDPPAAFRTARVRQVELEADLARLAAAAEAAAVERRRMERLGAGWPAWLALADARRRAIELNLEGSPQPDLPPDLLERMARSQQELDASAVRSDELSAERQQVAAERDRTPLDAQLLAARPTLEQLLVSLPDLRTDRTRIADLDRDRTDRDATLAEALRRLGPGWTEDRLLAVDDSLASQNAIDGRFRASLESADRDLVSARADSAGAEHALSDARADLAAIGPVGPDEPGRALPPATLQPIWLLAGLVLAAIAGLGAIAFGLGFAQSLVLAVVIGVAVGSVGTLADRSAGRPRSPADAQGAPDAARREERAGRVRAADQRRQAAAVRLTAAEDARASAWSDWRAWLSEHGLDPDLDREGAARVMAGAVTAKAILTSRQSIERRRADAAARLAAGEAEAAELLRALGRPADDPVAGLEALRRELAAALSAQAAHDRAGQDMARIEAAGTANDRAREAARAEQQAVFAAGGADDSASLRAIVAQAAQHSQVQVELKAAEDTLIALSGPGPVVASFEADLAGFDDFAEIDAGLAAAIEQARSIEAERATVHELLGAERDRMAEIERSSEAASLRQERADRVAELEVLAVAWSTTTIALELLRRTRNRYEREHRPDVLRTAEELLANWTDGRYARILAPLGKQIQELERRDGVIVPINGLSTGTAEQLYLALRFGLVEHFAREAESLPIVMDDILVNFDPRRAERAARSIEDLATRHQVLYFTCHPATPLVPTRSIDLPSIAAV